MLLEGATSGSDATFEPPSPPDCAASASAAYAAWPREAPPSLRAIVESTLLLRGSKSAARRIQTLLQAKMQPKSVLPVSGIDTPLHQSMRSHAVRTKVLLFAFRSAHAVRSKLRSHC